MANMVCFLFLCTVLQTPRVQASHGLHYMLVYKQSEYKRKPRLLVSFSKPYQYLHQTLEMKNVHVDEPNPVRCYDLIVSPIYQPL